MPPISERDLRDSSTEDGQLTDALAAWLPTGDPATREKLLEFMRRAAAAHVDPIATLHAALTRWFPGEAIAMLPNLQPTTPPIGPGGIGIESSAPIRRPTMWPQRPKRLTDELFSSWLHRTAAAVGISPHRFLRDVARLEGLGDVDRDVSRATLERLGLLSGQTPEHLARGTLPDHPVTSPEKTSAVVEDLLLRDGRFLLRRPGRDARGRAKPRLQYCPSCLRTDERPHLRRSWRFAHSVACETHKCRLLDRCCQCGTYVSPLAQRQLGADFCCQACSTPLRAASIIAAAPIVPRQRSVDAMLFYVATQMSEAERQVHLDTLARSLRTTSYEPLASRAMRMSDLKPSVVDKWFGQAISPEHASILACLAANGTAYRLLAKESPDEWRRRMRTPHRNDPPRWITDALGSTRVELQAHRHGQ